MTTETTRSATSAQRRYNSAMATIQIRDIPEDAYEALRRRAKAEGKSLQSYMREQVVELARPMDDAEGWAEYEAMLARTPPRNVTTESILADLDAGRHER
jgi:plasmid stability protein